MEYREYCLHGILLIKIKNSKIHEQGATFPYMGDGGWSTECILVLNLPWSIENTFHSEMFFLNSTFHKRREVGGYFYLQGGGEEI